ncbi:MAG: DMT family transporter [Thermoplasmata archaeon]|nr:MAG: DMT family transporter [Thermoplasmata archaeon]
MNPDAKVKPEVGILIAIISVSFAALFIRWSSAHPMVVAFYRLAFASLILLPITLYTSRKELFSIDKKLLAVLIGVGAILAIHFGAWISSLYYTTVASSVLLVTSHPIIVASVSHYIFKEKHNVKAAGGIVLALAGMIVISWGDAFFGFEYFIGDVLALVGMVAVAVYMLAGRKIRQNLDLFVYVFIVYSSAALFLLIGCLSLKAQLYPLPQDDYILFLALAIIPSIFGHTVYNWTLKYVSATVISVSLLGEPILASLWAVIFLEEFPSNTIYLGGAMILIGIIMVSSVGINSKNG